MKSDYRQTTSFELDTSSDRIAWAVPLLLLAFFGAIFPFTLNYESIIRTSVITPKLLRSWLLRVFS